MDITFNYISFGNRDSVESSVKSVSMSRGRMFEYTPTDIEKRVEDLSETSIAFLRQLPTFLCSEIDNEGGTASMVVKYIRINEIKPGRREVFLSFDTIIDFGVVEFTTPEQAQEIFYVEKFEVYRTHWAVRRGDPRQILSNLAALKPDQATNVNSQPEQIVDSPPPRSKNIIGRADSVANFLETLYSAPPEQNSEAFFRGHSDANYELTPYLLRRWPNGAWQFMPDEDRLCKELLIAHYDEFQSDQYCFDRLVRMQHYGLPTRLLDISSNPLIALFFACNSPSKRSIDGEVITFQILADRLKYYDSDTVSCISNLSNLTYAQKEQIDLALSVSDFNKTNPAKKLLHHIKSEKGFFESRIVPDDLGSIVCAKAKRTNNRIKSQLGAFLLFGHEAILPETGNDGVKIARVTIASENKATILEQLDRININEATVYPSIDQTAEHLRDRYLRASEPA